MPISFLVLLRMLEPRSSATPYSVTTRSTRFLNVVTAAPGCSWATMRETDSSAVVGCRRINDCPCSASTAPREVWLAPRGRPVVTAEGLRGALAKEVDLEGGVDGHVTGERRAAKEK